MRHRKSCVKLGRTASHRNAMLRNMATSLFEHKSIVTTVSKAKAVKPVLDKLVNLAKKGDLASYRRGLAMVSRRKVLKQLFADAKAGEVGAGRESGYVTSARVNIRPGDASVMVRMTLIGKDYQKASTGASKTRVVDRSRRVAASKAQDSRKGPEGSKPEPSGSKPEPAE
jgi:large subunit ribosomal protein L17